MTKQLHIVAVSLTVPKGQVIGELTSKAATYHWRQVSHNSRSRASTDRGESHKGRQQQSKAPKMEDLCKANYEGTARIASRGPARPHQAATMEDANFPNPGSALGPELHGTGEAVLFFRDSPEMSQSRYDVKTASRVMNSGLADESTEGGFPQAACCLHT